MPKKKILKNHQPMLQEIREPLDVKSAEEIAKKYKFKTTNYKTLAEKLNKAYEYYPTDKDIYQSQNLRLSDQKEFLKRIKQASQDLSNQLTQIESPAQDLSHLLDDGGIIVSRILITEYIPLLDEVRSIPRQLSQFILNLKRLHCYALTAMKTIPPDKGGSKSSAEPLIFLIIRLADIYEEETKKKATAWYNDAKDRYSPFYNFVEDCLLFLQINHETKDLIPHIKKALKLQSSQ